MSAMSQTERKVKTTREILLEAKAAAGGLPLSTQKKNEALLSMADCLLEFEGPIRLLIPTHSQLSKNVFPYPKGLGIGPDWRYIFEDPKLSKGTAHAQPFKLWPLYNLLALAFSLWMHGCNVSRICSLGCLLYFKI